MESKGKAWEACVQSHGIAVQDKALTALQKKASFFARADQTDEVSRAMSKIVPGTILDVVGTDGPQLRAPAPTGSGTTVTVPQLPQGSLTRSLMSSRDKNCLKANLNREVSPLRLIFHLQDLYGIHMAHQKAPTRPNIDPQLGH